MATVKEIKAQLDEAGIEYKTYMGKAELEDLLPEEEVVEEPVEELPEELPEELEELEVQTQEPQVEEKLDYRIIDVNGKKRKEFRRPDGTTYTELIE